MKRSPVQPYEVTITFIARYRVIMAATSQEEAHRLACQATLPLPAAVEVVERTVISAPVQEERSGNP